MGSTNYFDTFITVAPDSHTEAGTAPPESASPSVALRQFRLIAAHPYRFTSDDILFTVHADRREIPESERAAARAAFFSKGQACLRASDLPKKYGWGVHADAQGRVALFGVETPEYRAFAAGEGVTAVKAAMRSKR